MSRRKTVALHLNIVKPLIKSKCRNNVIFCEQMGKHPRWVSDWGKIPSKNLPSPEEAALMCAILQVTPEEILTEPEDIELVQGLIDSQRPEQKEKPAPIGDEPNKKKLLDSVDSMDMSELLELMKKVTNAIQKRGNS